MSNNLSDSVAHFDVMYSSYYEAEQKQDFFSDYIRKVFAYKAGTLESLEGLTDGFCKLFADLFFLLMKKGVLSLDEVKNLLGSEADNLVRVDDKWVS